MPEGRRVASRWVPGGVYAIGLLSWWLYNHASPGIANRVIGVYAACLLAGPAVIYAARRSAGETAGRAALWGLAVPVAWLAKELWRVTAVHPFVESLYYALNPLSLGIFGATWVPMAVVELARRRRRSGAWRLGGWPGVTLAVFVLLAVAAFVAGHDNGGREIFYAYIRLYSFLFGDAPTAGSVADP